MPLPILILASGHGRKSLYDWANASPYVPELLQLDVRFEHRQSSGSFVSEYFEVRFLLPSSRSLSLNLVLPPMNSAWPLTWWSVRKGDSESWATSGGAGAVSGVGAPIRSTTGPARICS